MAEKNVLLKWFRDGDEGGSGKVSRAVLVDVLKMNGLSTGEIDNILANWSGQGRIPYEEFVQWVCGKPPRSPGIDMTPVELQVMPTDMQRETVLQTLVLLTSAACWFAGKGRIRVDYSPSVQSASLGFSVVDSNLSSATALTDKVKELVARATIEHEMLPLKEATSRLTADASVDSAALVGSMSAEVESVGLHVVSMGDARFRAPAVASVTSTSALKTVPWEIRATTKPGQFELIGPTSDLRGLSEGKIGRFGSQLPLDLGVTDCNKAVQESSQTNEALRVEAMHENTLADMSAKIVETAKKSACVVIICGPSSSGKTTFACRLSMHIQARGVDAKPLECDMYFKARADPTHPRDAKGELNFEDPGSLRLDKIKQDLKSLFNGTRIELPKFCFKTGTNNDKSGKHMQLQSGGVLVVEGIFGLHPTFLSAFSDVALFKVLIGPWSGARLGGLHIVPERKLRLLRRIGRDVAKRGVDAEKVIQRYASVVSGENLNIFPYAADANVVFDSALHYELPALRSIIGKNVEAVSSKDAAIQFRQRELANYLSWAECWPAASYCQTPTSILCEFLGDSIFE
jgi:uridine kinase